jgi:hypothetical protein
MLVTVAAATLPASAVSIGRAEDHLAAVRDALAALAYAAAFAAIVAPLVFATMGTGSRVIGYAAFIGLIGAPELVAPWTREALPPGWHELTSIPAALSAVATGVRLGGAAIWPLARALTALAACGAASLVVVLVRVGRARVEADGW